MSIRLMLLPALLASSMAAAPAFAQTAATRATTAAAATAATPGTSAVPAAAAPATATAAATAPTTRRDMVVERRITALRSKLKITAAEQKPFDDFAQAMRENAHRMDDAITEKRAGAATASAVDQMKAYAGLAQAHSEEVNRLVGPFTTLYEALSPEQKKLADQSFRDFSNNPRMREARG